MADSKSGARNSQEKSGVSYSDRKEEYGFKKKRERERERDIVCQKDTEAKGALSETRVETSFEQQKKLSSIGL